MLKDRGSENILHRGPRKVQRPNKYVKGPVETDKKRTGKLLSSG